MTDSLNQATLTDRAIFAGSEALAGRRCGLRSLLPFAGAAVIASVAYMDPGNFATNIQAGAKYQLQPALGRRPRQYHRDDIPGAVGEARHRHRSQPCRTLPRTAVAASKYRFASG